MKATIYISRDSSALSMGAESVARAIALSEPRWHVTDSSTFRIELCNA